MSPEVILVRVLLGSIFLVGMITGQGVHERRGSTIIPNVLIDALIRTLNRRTVTGNANRREPDPVVTTSRGLAPTTAPLPPPIDEIIYQAESGIAAIRRADQLRLQRDGSVVMEGDIVMDQSELTDLDKQIRLDLLEEQLLRTLPAARQNDTFFRDRLRLMLERRETASPVRRKRAARRSRSRRWPNALVNVRIASSGFTRAHKNRIAASMNEISEKTCICFNIISRSQALQRVPHVRIVNGNGCRSRVGRRLRNQDGTRSQDLTLSRSCRVTRVATHEFLHTLGLHHEQSRPDRNRYVRVFRRNVERGKRGNFRRYSRVTINSFGLPYDYRSIMHYSNRAFSRNGRYTIVPRPQRNRRRFLDRIGRSNRMSTNDAEVIRRMYSCRGTGTSCSGYPYRFP